MYKAYIPYESLDRSTMASAATEKEILRDRLELEIPDKNFVANIIPHEPAPIANLEEAVREALENPVAGPKFSELIGPDKSIVIITDNQFRPTPTAKYLSVILDILEEAGVKKGGVAIGGMMVSHEVPMSDEDIKAKLGEKNVDRILEKGWEIWQNEPRNPEANKFIGFTKAGTPVWANKKLMRFDVKFGLPLTQAHPWGYGGGGKLALAMCSEETIEINHSRSLPLSPATHYGALTGPMRSDIDDIARLIGYRYALNSIMDTKGRIIDLTFGELPESHRESIRKYNKIYAYDEPRLWQRKPDIVICGTYGMSDHLFFHTGWGVNSADLLCRDGGTIIYCSPCPGYRDFPGFALMDLMKPYMPPTAENFERILRDIYRRKIPMWSGCIWVPIYEVMLRKHLTIVTLKENVEFGREIGLDVTDSVQDAFEAALKRHGPDARVAILPYARMQLPIWAVEM
jgi:nickel-dependent lactate racemase